MPMEHLFKIILIGDSGVGKSTVISRFKGERWPQTRMMTLEPEKYLKSYPELGVKLELWDTPGSDEKRTLSAFSYQGAMGVMAFFDLSKEETFNNVENWIRMATEYASGNQTGDLKVFIVGNKKDIKSNGFSDSELNHLLQKYNAEYHEISAKDRNTSAIEEIFSNLAKALAENLQIPVPVNNHDKRADQGGFKCLLL